VVLSERIEIKLMFLIEAIYPFRHYFYTQLVACTFKILSRQRTYGNRNPITKNSTLLTGDLIHLCMKKASF